MKTSSETAIIFMLDLPSHEFPLEVRVVNKPSELDKLVQALQDAVTEVLTMRKQMWPLEEYPPK